MLLSPREEKLLKAFLELGKLSLKTMADILQVSSRTVYRTLSDLTVSLAAVDIQLVKEGRLYHIEGDLAALDQIQEAENFLPHDRRNLISYELLVAQGVLTNDYLQARLGVSNVTIIQDVAVVADRLADFGLTLTRKKGYQLSGTPAQKRRLLANLLTNCIAISAFWSDDYEKFSVLDRVKTQQARQVFEAHQSELPDMDPKMRQYLIILLALSENRTDLASHHKVSKQALDFATKLYGKLSQQAQAFFNLQEILFYAGILDEMVLKRQEVPLFTEKFDSEFFYNISNLIDTVSLYTKIEFYKDKLLFKFLFSHIRLSLGVPLLFPEPSTVNFAHLSIQHNSYLHTVIGLVMQDIFPKHILNEYEFEMVTLHFASSLRRSPDIYPIRLLLLTDERTLTRELLVTKIKSVAPFVEWIDVRNTTEVSELDFDQYDYHLTTKPIAQCQLPLISTFPTTQEVLALQEKLQDIQENRTVVVRRELKVKQSVDLQNYLQASSHLLQNFELVSLPNPEDFAQTVQLIMGELDEVGDSAYLAQKLLDRFQTSPLAIPNTGLALLHTRSGQVSQSLFKMVALSQPVSAPSMNGHMEPVSRIILMLTRLEETEEMQRLMVAISQSIIENHLYTEIYKTGNQAIIYQLLNQIFNENIKKLEN